jgi:hypothetical protein
MLVYSQNSLKTRRFNLAEDTVSRNSVLSLLSDLETKVQSLELPRRTRKRMASAILFLGDLLNRSDGTVVFPRGRDFQSIQELSLGSEMKRSWWF